MKQPTKPSPDLSRLTPAQRRNYEAGCRLVEKKLALAKLEKVKRLAQPRAYRIVKGEPQPRQLEAAAPGRGARMALELGMAMVSRKLAAARLAEIARKAVPRSFRITPSAASSKNFDAGRPRTVRGGVRTHVIFSTFAD